MGWNDHGNFITLRCEECDAANEIWVWDGDKPNCPECGSDAVHDVLSDDEDELNPDSLAALLERQYGK